MKIFSRGMAAPWAVFLFLFLASPLRVSTGQSSKSDGKNFDGPAELLREYVKSSWKDTPATGRTWAIRSGENIEPVLARASCGDIIQLQAGATFRGNFVVPAKNCDDSHWIIIRTSAPDSSLPPEGARLTPCYAGVSSLAGRPPWNCASTANVLAKIEFNGNGGSGPITFSPGANHYRLMGLEVTRPVSSAAIYNLIQFDGPADHLVFDRLWIHGTAEGDTVRGIFLGPSRYLAVVDSFFSDFHCAARSSPCVDTQAIAGGISDNAMGPYKIVNNFLEAAGENILFGGGSATMTPKDIEIRHNHLFKPLIWMRGEAGYVGGTDGNPFIVKNLLELKNAQRVLIDGNIMEDSWGGFTQVGFAIVLTPKNQGGSFGRNLCPICQVTDVTIRYDSISHVAGGLQIANDLAGKGAPLDGQRYSIHDIVIDDINGVRYGGPGLFAEVLTAAGAPLLQSVTINHVTAFPPSTMYLIGDMVAATTQMKNFVFTNSIVSAGTYPIWSTGGGPKNCAYNDKPLTTFNACFSPYTFAKNAVIGTSSSYPPSLWPSGNFFPATASAVQFANFNNGNGGNYQLKRTSPYRNAGTDGKDLGADVSAILSETTGVY
jgi:hypothetical protein